MKKYLATVSAILWTLAPTLMFLAVMNHLDVMADVAGMVAVVACVPTGALIVDCAMNSLQRRLVVTICEVIARADAERELTRIR